MASRYIIDVQKPFKSFYSFRAKIDIPATDKVFSLDTSNRNNYPHYNSSKIEVISANGNTIVVSESVSEGGTFTFDNFGGYQIIYSGNIRRNVSAGNVMYNEYDDYKITYGISVVRNNLPLKKWTVTEVLNRLFDLAEPIHEYEKPRFRLQGVNDDGTFEAGSQAEKFDKILAPEFSFTKQTLRECLKQVGYIVHGEPRLTPKKDGTGTWYYEVSYDLYGGTERWRNAHRRYIANTVSYTAEQFATALDTNPENLINKLKDYNGTIKEPYAFGRKSVRTEQMYVQITETNMLIFTQYPIYEVAEVRFLGEYPNAGIDVDITPYLFESSVYNSQLSSYESSYPYSKAYGLMYTQGERNITALNFKPENPISEVFTRYAIVNILREATGDRNYTPSDYARLSFRVTYTPIYNARVRQVKPNYTEYDTEATQIYNQTSNLVESRAFGENIKGVIARMGNPEISRTYMFTRLSQIPRAGMKYDDDYYISAVYTEYFTPYIRCTVALTKDFNRISQYIGIPSYKRYSEVSQTMAAERNVVYEEYIVVGDNIQRITPFVIRNYFMYYVKGIFLQNAPTTNTPLNCVIAWGGSYNDPQDGINAVCLPVIASAYGNSISFSWEYQDNYSAGPTATYAEGGVGGNSVRGYFQTDYPYADYYGRMYYYNFKIAQSPNTTSEAFALPGGVSKHNAPTSSDYLHTGVRPFIIRKDSREKLQVNFQIHFVSNRKGLIIGSAMASYCPAVRRKNNSLVAKLYVLDRPIDKFAENLSAAGIDLSAIDASRTAELTMPQSAYDNYIQLAGGNTFPADGKAWVIAIQPIKGDEEQVEDEKGNTTTFQKVEGGDLLLGMNMDIKAGDPFETIYLTPTKSVYDKTVWKDKK